MIITILYYFDAYDDGVMEIVILVAEDVDVVARVDIHDGQGIGIADGSVFLHTGEPFNDIAIAGVGGDGDKESTSSFGSGAAGDCFGEKGSTL